MAVTSSYVHSESETPHTSFTNNNSPIPEIPSTIITNMSTNSIELSHRLNALELQLTTNNTPQPTALPTPETIKTLQDDITLIKQLLNLTIPSLRHQITTLQSQLPNSPQPRTHAEKLHSASRNPSLVRIATGATLPSGVTNIEAYLREASELESLARKLRLLAVETRTGCGGSYVLEAEDAEALAVDLRERAVEAGGRVSGLEVEVRGAVDGDDDDDGDVEGSEVEAFGGSDVGAEGLGSRGVEIASVTRGLSDAAGMSSVTCESSVTRGSSDMVDTATDIQDHRHEIQSRAADANEVDTTSQQSSSTTSNPRLLARQTTTPTIWQPPHILNLPPLPTALLSQIPSSPRTTTTFTKRFLLKLLCGKNWCGSFYHIPTSIPHPLLPNRGFWLLSSFHEPLFPPHPGAHGSILTPVLRPQNLTFGPRPDAYISAPVFVEKGRDAYMYFGMYTPVRAPDRLDHMRCVNIPRAVKEFWAEELCKTGRGEWVTAFLKEHLGGRPKYWGPLPKHPGDWVAEEALRGFGERLADWDREVEEWVGQLGKQDVLMAFEEADAEVVPGIRFWCWGLACVDWDGGFYDVLCREALEEVDGKKRA